MPPKPVPPPHSCRLWWSVRGPFRLPIRCHQCALGDWEVFDVDKAGCMQCGKLHMCSEDKCIGEMENDHKACEITGCWTRTRNFQQGYTDTAIPPPNATNCVTNPAARPWVESEQVAKWMHVLLTSETAKKCIQREIKRVSDKASSAFNKVAKGFKLDGRQPNLLEIFAETRFALGNLRVPGRLPQCKKEVDELIRACVIAVVGFTGNFRWVLSPFVPSVKLDLFVIGLIYMLRHGLVMYDTLHVIPRFPVLRRLLPMETSLKAHFKVPCKIITETENTVKNALKKMDRKKLKNLMV